MEIAVQIMCLYHGRCIFNDDVCRALSLHQPTYHGWSDSLALWRCISVAQVWRSRLSLNNKHLLILVLASFVPYPVNDVWLALNSKGAGHVVAVGSQPKSR
jgi:hypothetical protein